MRFAIGNKLSSIRGRNFPCLYFIFEVVRIESVEAALCRFRLRIHQESNRSTFRAGKGNIVREVVSHPVHFPEPEQLGARAFHHIVVERTISGGSSSTTFRTSAGSTGTHP